jgi:hypothetical protein
MSCELDVVPGRPCDLPGCAESTYPSLSLSRRAPALSTKGEACARLGWICIATSARSRSRRTARSGRPVGLRRGATRWRCSRRVWWRATSWRSRRRPGRTKKRPHVAVHEHRVRERVAVRTRARFEDALSEALDIRRLLEPDAIGPFYDLRLRRGRTYRSPTTSCGSKPSCTGTRPRRPDRLPASGPRGAPNERIVDADTASHLN